MSNVQAVGITLYMALAIIQGVSSGGIAIVRRRVSTLESAIALSELDENEFGIPSLRAEISRVEISFQAINRTVLVCAMILALVAVIWFGYSSIYFAYVIGPVELLVMLFFYLIAPFVLFFFVTSLVYFKCKDITLKCKFAEKEFVARTL